MLKTRLKTIISRDYSTKETITDFLMIINEPIVENAALE
jgi:hypothetical protein